MSLQFARVALRQPGRRLFATASTTVSLKYDLHEPPTKTSSGEQRPILFLHGLFGSKKNNRGISKRLASDLGRPIFALDLRNHGESPHTVIHDYTSMAADVRAFIKEHGLGAPTLIGHSMGAKTAMTLALQSPEDVHDLVAVDNAPLDAALGSDFPHYLRGMQKIDAAGITKLSEADSILSEYEEASFSLPIRQFILGNLHIPAGSKTRRFRIPLTTLAKSVGGMGDFPFKDPEAVRFEKPALFVRGTKSTYVPDEVLPLIGQFFPRFRLVDIDAGHWVISENPEEFRRAVVDFLTPSDDSSD
ncbi:related to alpha/beta hydrolase [Cephalotrichum gorgonifer]|uniref:Related to alpha/beta hydrolase n=1 Tax=Cephalotrichum gorgonifer TaxID=2041049 RepID=A0AAE8SSM7_9PEZI|nr:related to alpha/beta hydrolase [Cephalotrichum gorgonifer]